MLSFCAQVNSPPAHHFVDEGGSQSFESFRRTSSLNPRRCTPAILRWPCSPDPGALVHWRAGRRLIFLGCSHAVEAVENGLCLGGAVRRRTSLLGGVGGHLLASRKVRSLRLASNSRPIRPILRTAHHAVELDSCTQVRLCASRCAAPAADGPPASLASLPPPPPPPPPSRARRARQPRRLVSLVPLCRLESSIASRGHQYGDVGVRAHAPNEHKNPLYPYKSHGKARGPTRVTVRAHTARRGRHGVKGSFRASGHLARHRVVPGAAGGVEKYELRFVRSRVHGPIYYQTY